MHESGLPARDGAPDRGIRMNGRGAREIGVRDRGGWLEFDPPAGRRSIQGNRGCAGSGSMVSNFKNRAVPMITTRVRQAISMTVAAATLAFAAGSAQAAVYSGRWDPSFGGIFPDLGWKGSATFILPDSCVGLTGSFANAAAGCGGNGMQVTG